MLAHESSWQVVLGPRKKAAKGRGRERHHRKKKKEERMTAVKYVAQQCKGNMQREKKCNCSYNIQRKNGSKTVASQEAGRCLGGV